MDALKTFFEMGGYAVYVWTAYGAATLGICGVLIFSLRSWKAREREFSALRPQRGRVDASPMKTSAALAKEST